MGPRGKVAMWLEILSLYDFAIEYRPGKKHGQCDALSRCENLTALGNTSEHLKWGHAPSSSKERRKCCTKHGSLNPLQFRCR